MKILVRLQRFLPPSLVYGALLASFAVTVPAAAQTSANFTVPGDSNLFAAGQSDPTTYGGLPAVQVTGLPLTAGTTFTFDATGAVSQGGGVAPYGPDGAGIGAGYYYPSIPGFGVSGLNGVGFVALVGIFLNDDMPGRSSTVPRTLDYSAGVTPPGGANYTRFQPSLNEVFFIGDGKDANGNAQTIVTPVGATRLFIGVADSGYGDNSGQFAVTVHATAPGTGVLVRVPGDSKPWLAGQPDGTNNGSDIAPRDSPVLVPGLTLGKGAVLTVSTTGIGTLSGQQEALALADGTGTRVSYAAENGIAGVEGVSQSALVGVFLDASTPTVGSTPPDINYTDGYDQAAQFEPQLRQVFFIGDGHDSSGNQQKIIVPDGATRFYLGYIDDSKIWSDNGGELDVTVNSSGGGGPINVPGTASLWLAGQPDGATATSGTDSAPAESPTLVTGLTLTAGQTLTFNATGGTSVDPSRPIRATPDGDVLGDDFHYPENGISGVTSVPAASLMGVFLTNAVPGNTYAATLDYNSGTPAGGLDYASFQPALGQAFFIGDGKDSGGNTQRIIVPAGATRLYLGSMDEGGWYDNSGSFVVTINGGGTVPGGNLIVPGTANPFLAGLPDGTTASDGDDSAPAESPVLVPGLTLHPNKPLNFSVGGSVSTDAAVQPTEGPDGGFFFAHAAENSFSKTVAPINSLIGVFLSDAAPDPTVVDTAVRDFSDTAATNGGVNFLGYQPRLGEPFFIGDGLTSTGTAQNVYPPTGATRLFLGVLDGNDYFNNLGQFNVGVTQSSDIDTDDLRLGQSVTTPSDTGGASALIGDTITYTFHVKNEGSHTFTNVVVKDVLPGVCELVSASDGGTVKGGIVTWNLGTLAPTGTGAAKDLTLRVKTFATGDSGQNVSAAQINQVINNTNYYLTGDALPQAIPGLDLNNATTLQAPVSVAITSNGAVVTPGGTLIYTITLKNNSTATVKKPMVTLALPGGVKFTEASYVDKNGNPVALTTTDNVNFTSTAGTFTLNGGSLAIFTAGNLKAGESEQLVLTVQVPYDVLATAAVNFGSAKLVTKTSDGSGQNSYGIAVPNTKLSGVAPSALPQLTLYKFVPDPVTIVQAIAVESFGEPLVAAVLQTVFPGATGGAALDKIHKTLNPSIIDGTGEDGVYEQQVVAPSQPGGPDQSTITYALIYTNLGGAKVQKVTVQDRVPTGTNYVDGSAMTVDKTGALVPANVTLADNNRTLVFNVGNIAADKSTKPAFGIITYQVQVLAPSAGGLAVGSLIEATGGALNTSSLFHTTVAEPEEIDTRLVAPGNLFVEPLQFTPNPKPGATLIYETYYKNTGGLKVDDATLVDTLPPGVINVKAVFTLGDSGTVETTSANQVKIHLPTLKKKAEGRVRITAQATDASFDPNGLLVKNLTQLFSAELGDTTLAARSRPTPRVNGARPRDLVLAPVLSIENISRGGVLGAPRIFASVTAPLSVKEGDTFDCLVAFSNPTDYQASPVGGLLYVPSGATFVSANIPNAAVTTDVDGNKTVSFPSRVQNGQIYVIPAHGSLLRRVTFRAGAGTAGKTLMSLGATSDTTFAPLSNGTSVSIAPVYSGKTATYVYAADQSFASVKSQIVTAALAVQGLKVAELEGLPNYQAKVNALTPDALGIALGGADAVAFDNNTLAVPLGSNQVLAVGAAKGLLINASALSAAGGSSLITQDGGGLVAQGGGNLIRVANLVAQGGGNLIDANGRDVDSILSGLVAQGGGNLVAQGGGNLVASGGQNLITQNGGGLVAQGGGNLAGYLISNATGAILDVKASSLVAATGGALAANVSNLVAQGGGNLVAPGGGKLVAQGGGNLVAQGGGNLVAQGGGNLVALGDGNLQVSSDASVTAMQMGNGLIVAGGGNLVAQGGGNLVAQGGGN